MEIDESPIKDENGIVVGIAGAARDVTMRKKAEQALRASDEKYRLIMASMKDAVYITSKERRIEYTNPRMIEKIGRDAIGEYCYKAIFENDTQCAWCILDQVQHGKCVEFEFENPKDSRFYTVINTPVFNTDGTISKLGIIRDITDQRKIELMLRQSQKMEAIGTLAGGVAHEFNNILAIILGNAELAIGGVPEWNPAKNFLEEIRKASLRAKNIVRQILSFARKMPPVYKPLEIGAVVKEALRLIRATIPANIEIHQRIRCDSEVILSNPTEINQIIMNLCSNAVHAMEEGTGILEIHLEVVFLDNLSVARYEDLTTGKYVKLTVKDTGSGIDPAIIDRIFDPYFTTKNVDKGLGMGLAVVFGIVKEHEGAIKVMSEIGKGAAVEILFPVAEVQSEEKVGQSDHLPTGTECILFVDDEESLVELAQKLLERLGYKVEAKTNPAEALRLFQEKSDKFDLVITDMAMPVMTGDRLLKEITKIKPNIPIILCTGHSDRIDGVKAKEMGFAICAMKPLEHASLAGIVRAALDKAKE
ncbi:MAG: hybrid sensor histidine kinase/response regulator [Desulfobacterium sp.]|nr:hybrid sensor histidine kinase/response regulator [Desulfobacterium sp.]